MFRLSGACIRDPAFILDRDVTKFEFEFNNVQTSNIFNGFEICRTIRIRRILKVKIRS